MKLIAYIVVSTLMSSFAFAQQIPKKIDAVRVEKAPRIDGILEAEVWGKVMPSGGFKQFSPRFDAPAIHPTEIKLAYDNTAIYIAAFMFDSRPDSI